MSDPFAHTFAIGDPQAPFETFRAILDAHGVLDHEGRVRADTALISLGDHFDWGKREERAQAAEDALALTEWLASHPPEQVIMIAGNHDLARVGELDGIDDATFARAQAAADTIGTDDEDGNAAFRAEHGFFTAELVNRDFSTYRAAQRTLVDDLLRARRFKLAHAHGDLLFVHAGITKLELDVLGVRGVRAAEIADALNAALARAVDERARTGAPLSIPGVHVPGNAEREGYGALYHRPTRGLTDEEQHELDKPFPRRRFDPADLPKGLVQVVGHIRDSKCRRLLADWCDNAAVTDGVLRHLVVDGRGGRYRHGLPASIDPRAATVLFVDGGMSSVRADPRAYQLLDVERRCVADHAR